MNPTPPHEEPGDDPRARAGHAADPAPGPDAEHRNAYSVGYERAGAPPDLDAGVPQLRSMDLRRMNRRALAFLAATILLLIALAFLLLKSTSGAKVTSRGRSERVQVPALPQQPQVPQRMPQTSVAAPTPAAVPAPVPATPLPLIPTQPPLPLVPSAIVRGQSTPSLLERRTMADDASFVEKQPAGAGDPSGTLAGAARGVGHHGSGATSAHALVDLDTLMLRGTYVRCVLETRIISDIPGFTSCVVTEPVYSFDGRRLLVPKGSKVFGEYNHGPVGSRIAVVWDRIVTPSGIDVNMSSPGVDNLGGAGLPGHLDSHWASRIGAALLISLMSDAFLYEGEKHGPRTDNISPAGGFVVQTPFQSNTAQTLQNLANQAVQQSANRKATLTINQGSLIAIYVTKDVDFSGVMARN